ncbi:MAG TPA: hypothetical protein VJ875_25885 [Pyrinomonadaceae bacterium]|nr:hypothetical protein [Pyrinomonadaceae bacterium]
MNLLLKLFTFLLVAPLFVAAQDDSDWPSLSYLRSDYKAVSVVVHIRIEQAEITGRVGGYENWKVNAVVLESFKGRFKKGDAIEYFHGAEAGLKREHFNGEKIVFLLAETDQERKLHYSVLENSTLPYTKARVAKLRLIRRSFVPFRGKRRLHYFVRGSIFTSSGCV